MSRSIDRLKAVEELITKLNLSHDLLDAKKISLSVDWKVELIGENEELVPVVNVTIER
jgi:hypothetical protein